MVERQEETAHQGHCRGPLKRRAARLTGCYSEKTGKTYDADVLLEDTGEYVNFKLDFGQRKGGPS